MKEYNDRWNKQLVQPGVTEENVQCKQTQKVQEMQNLLDRVWPIVTKYNDVDESEGAAMLKLQDQVTSLTAEVEEKTKEVQSLKRELDDQAFTIYNLVGEVEHLRQSLERLRK